MAPPPAASRFRLGWTVVTVAGLCASAATALLMAEWLAHGLGHPLGFDDAYMFVRYARNILSGLGFAWNPDGVPTYGSTSLLWVGFVLPFVAWLPPDEALPLASWLAGTAALGVMAVISARFARSQPLRWLPLTFGLVAAPLMSWHVFAYHLVSGMDTALTLLANSVLVGALIAYRARPSSRAAGLVGALSFLAVLARPDNVPCALLAPALLWLTRPGPPRWPDLAPLLFVPVILLGAQLLLCWLYFGVPIPLSFFAKSLNSYVGFRNAENAVTYLDAGTVCALPFLGTLLAALRPGRTRKILPFLLPVALTFAYLLTVRQIMGAAARFYVPFMPFLVVPALLEADRALLASHNRFAIKLLVWLAGLYLLYFASQPLWQAAEAQYARLVVPSAIPEPILVLRAHRALPTVDGFEALATFGQDVLARLPPGATAATTEVGYLGAISRQIAIVDLAGLNDSQIAVDGFSMAYLFRRAPDVILLPHVNYTGLRREMLTDRSFLYKYELIAGAFNYGVAVRQDSPFRGLIMAGLAKAWATLYPGFALSDYVVRGTGDGGQARSPTP